MNKEESPYCEICGHCGEIGCCGIINFVENHIKGKINCKYEVERQLERIENENRNR